MKKSRSNVRAQQAMEALEPRQMLDALPAGAAYVAWGSGQLAAMQGSWLVQFEGQRDSAQAELLAMEVATRLGVHPTSVRGFARGQYAEILSDAPVTRAAAQRVLGEFDFLRSIEPNLVHSVSRVPNDTQFSQQWDKRNTGQIIQGQPGVAGADIGTIRAWDTTIGTRSAVVAVIDTGIDLTHPDLVQNLWVNPGETPGDGIDNDGNGFVDDVNGWDFGDNDNSPQDEATGAHGTLVSGVIGAVGNNGLGVSGVAWNVSLMGLKIADRLGALSTAAIVAAHDYATMMIGRGTNIVASNNSYGGFGQALYRDAPTGFDAEKDAIARFVAAGATFVVAAGNSAFDNDNPQFTFFPSSYNVPGVISVAATNNRDELAGFSNYGAQTVELGAPGEAVYTTALGGGYAFVDGTSFASPTVAGAVALLRSVKPNASAVEIREALFNSVDPLAALQGRVRSGGRLNVARAIDIIQIDGPVVRSVSPGPVSTQNLSGTSTPVDTFTINFSKDLDQASLSTSAVTLRGAGSDGTFGNGDDVLVPVQSVTRTPGNARQVTVRFNLASLPSGRLPVMAYRLTLAETGFRDTSLNFLNGNNVSGSPHVYNLRIVAVSGDNEPNDALAQATPVSFGPDGSARFSGVSLGNGVFGNLDVDLYRLDLARGGQITAELTAKRLPAGSTLDGVLRLFDANGVEITSNDQTFGDDPFVDFFVRTAGTYYVGVSGFGNARYNPAVAGSGAAQSIGIYDLRLNVKLSSDDVVTKVLFTSPTLPSGTDAFLGSDAPAGPTTNVPPNAPSQTQGTTTSFIDIADTRQIIDLNVKVRLTHPFVGDLSISLISPTGTEVTLVNRRGSSGDNFFNTVFDDEAGSSITTGSAPYTGSFRPEVALGFVDGQAAAGRWTLRIVDNAALNSGSLKNWALEFTFLNNIFGPFESNDTLTTASSLGLSGTGTASRTAFLGDGGFGNFDRDIFSFDAVAGTSLTAAVTSTGLLNSALRLFDASGQQIFLSNPDTTRGSGVPSYTFASGGRYYLAVSESANVAYDPATVATGVAAATTGNYTLSVTLAAGVSDPGQVLAGANVSTGASTGALFDAVNASGARSGLRFGGIEFLVAGGGSPQGFFGLSAAGSSFTNTIGGTASLPFSVTNESDPQNQRVTARGDFRGMTVERTFSFGKNDSFLAIDVYLTNTTQFTMSNVSWMEAFNPDPGVSLGDASRTTINDVSGTVARARYVNNEFGAPTGGLSVALAAPSADSRARATVLGSTQTVRDATALLAQSVNDPNDTASDGQLALVYDLGSVAAGAKVAMRYFVFFGNNAAAVDAALTTLNSGTGTGHLTANPQTPATETLSDGSTAPVLPYKVYFAEGAVNENIFEFIPISNPNDQPTRIVAIARYEEGQRDQVIFDQVIAARSRSGFTITTPEMFRNNTQLVRKHPQGFTNTYAIELRADKPVAATFSHYDLNILPRPSGVGEGFSSRVDTTWTFASVVKGGGVDDFILWYNTTNTNGKVTLTFYPQGGGQAYQATFDNSGFYRGGIAISNPNNPITLAGTTTPATMPDGTYGVVVSATHEIVASLSHYDRRATANVAEGSLGGASTGSTTGVIAEGQFGLNATSEIVSILNTGTASASVEFSFLFDNGSAYRAARTVAAGGAATLDVASLPNFPVGRPYGIFYESNNPVIVDVRSNAFGQQFASATADRAYTLWTFGEGFRPGDNSGHPGVIEHLRLYNPTANDLTIEITVAYDGVPGSETFRRTLPSRRVTEFDFDQFITGSRRTSLQYYSTTVKAPEPIVAYMLHFDRAFPGGFGTLGTPLGRSAPVT